MAGVGNVILMGGCTLSLISTGFIKIWRRLSNKRMLYFH